MGFYSSFLVANKVIVTSKANDDDQYIWTSTADSKFFVTKDPRGNTLGRGTRVTLLLKDDAAEYVEQDRIKNLVKKYSEFINYPISLYTSHEVTEEVPIDTPESKKSFKVTKYNEDGTEVVENNDDVEITTEEEQEATPIDENAPKTKTITR